VRTTLTIDDHVLSAARTRAHRRGTTIGAELPQLASAGLEAEASRSGSTSIGFPVLPEVTGHVITVEMIDEALAD